MGNVCACVDDYRMLKRSESIRETGTGQTKIRMTEQTADTSMNINDTLVSQAAATNEMTKKQTGEDQETHEVERLEECYKRHETKINNNLEKHMKMIESLLPSENLNEPETSEPMSETDDNSEKMKLLPDVKDPADIRTKLLDSCKEIKQYSSLMFDEFRKRDCKDANKTKTRNDLQDTGKSKEVSGQDAKTEKKDLKETVPVQTEVPTTNLQDSQESERKPTMKVEKYRPASASATVQLFNVQNGKIMDEIEEKLKTHLDDHLENVHFENCNSPDDILYNNLLIIPCIIATRYGTDADYAIKNIPNPGNTVLVLVHNIGAHALPQQKSSLYLYEKKFKNLRKILDLAFSTDNGFYSCEMNTENLDMLCELCKQSIGERL